MTMHKDPYTLLAEFLHAHASKTFAWGVNDCCLFAADWLVELGHPDLMADFRGTYSDARGAIRRWREVGGYGAEGGRRLAAAGLNNVATPITHARRGDVALVQASAHHPAFGIVDAGAVWGLTTAGLVQVPMTKVCAAWRSF